MKLGLKHSRTSQESPNLSYHGVLQATIKLKVGSEKLMFQQLLWKAGNSQTPGFGENLVSGSAT